MTDAASADVLVALGRIEASVEHARDELARSRENDTRMWARLDAHSERITALESAQPKLTALQRWGAAAGIVAVAVTVLSAIVAVLNGLYG